MIAITSSFVVCLREGYYFSDFFPFGIANDEIGPREIDDSMRIDTLAESYIFYNAKYQDLYVSFTSNHPLRLVAIFCRVTADMKKKWCEHYKNGLNL